jgi:transketolase
MKKDFFDTMLTVMRENKDVFFIMCGLGYPRVDEFLQEFPGRAINGEASEQACLDIAVGLTYANKIPVVYSITPFLLYRGFETIRTYINHEKLPVILVGVGRGDDYSKHDGFSHFAGDDMGFMHRFPFIESHWPENVELMKTTLADMVEKRKASYINIPR